MSDVRKEDRSTCRAGGKDMDFISGCRYNERLKAEEVY
jgi:hypothetical protein